MPKLESLAFPDAEPIGGLQSPTAFPLGVLINQFGGFG